MSEKIGLIILDSAALFYRLGLSADDSNEENVALRRELVNQIGLLHGIARKHLIAVVITNQVYKDVNTGELCPIGAMRLNTYQRPSSCLKRPDIETQSNASKHRSKCEGTNCEFMLTIKA